MPTTTSVWSSPVWLVSSAGAVGIALVWLSRTRLSEPLRRRMWRIVSVGVKPLHALYSGHVGDYATWLTVGLTGLGAAFAYAILGK
jgi:multicomponent Na+:H+ antiporter subunit D